MNSRLARAFLIVILIPLTAFSWPKDSNNLDNSKILANKTLSTAETILTFKDFQIKSVKEKEVQLQAITDNAGVKQVTDIRVNIEGGNLDFLISVLPNDRNVTINYRGSIKLK